MSSEASFQAFGAIVLAAGLSRRMGTENKLLKSLAGRPLISHALDMVAELGLRQLLVIAGQDVDGIAALLPRGSRLIANDQATEGMGSSIARGARVLDPALSGVFVALGDMPFIERADYRKLVHAFQPADGTTICVPCHEGRRGHPVLFGCNHIPALTNLGGDRGARGLLSASNARILEVPNCSEGVLIDLDTQEDFVDAERKAGQLPKYR